MISLDDKQEFAFDKPHPNSQLGQILAKEIGAPLFLRRVDKDHKEQPLLSFERYFNSDLTIDSAYFRTLNDVMLCVRKHAEKELTPKEEEKVCA